MVDKLISEYVSRMSLKDIDKFSKSHGIILKDSELKLVYKYIKNDWRTIIYGNPRGILDELKISLDSFTYQKIEELYIHFKDKFNSYL